MLGKKNKSQQRELRIILAATVVSQAISPPPKIRMSLKSLSLSHERTHIHKQKACLPAA